MDKAQPAIRYLNLEIETLEKGVKYVQSPVEGLWSPYVGSKNKSFCLVEKLKLCDSHVH